jgi:hypothetical protein
VLLGLVVFAGGGFPDAVRGLVALPAVLVAGGWLALALAGRAALPRLSSAALVFAAASLALICLTAASIAWSASGERSWTETNRALVYLALATVGALAAATRPDARLLGGIAGAAIGATLGWALLGRAVTSLGPDLSIPGQTHRLAGSIGYPNGLAVLGACAVPLALWAISERTAWQRACGALLLVLAAVAVPLTYSRTGLALAIGAGVVWIWRAPAPRVTPLLALACAAVAAAPAIALDVAGEDGLVFGLAVAAALVAAALVGPCLVRARVADEGRVLRGAAYAGIAVLVAALAAGVVRDGGPAGFVRSLWHQFAAAKPGSEGAQRLGGVGSFRWSWWKEAWRGFEARPFGGHGAGSFALTHLHYRTNALSITQEPHSMPMQLLTELGLAGFVLAAVATFGVLRVARSVARQVADDHEARVALAFVPALAILHALVDLDWALIAVDGIAIFVAGALVGLASPGPARRRARLVPAAAVAVVALAAAYSAGAPLLARGQLDRTATDPLAAASAGRLAHSYDPLLLAALLREASAAHLRGQDGDAQDYYLQATRLEPENPLPWTELGLFDWHVVRDVCSAYQAFNRAYTEDPASAVPGGPLDRTRRAVNKGACG